MRERYAIMRQVGATIEVIGVLADKDGYVNETNLGSKVDTLEAALLAVRWIRRYRTRRAAAGPAEQGRTP